MDEETRGAAQANQGAQRRTRQRAKSTGARQRLGVEVFSFCDGIPAALCLLPVFAVLPCFSPFAASAAVRLGLPGRHPSSPRPLRPGIGTEQIRGRGLLSLSMVYR